MTEADLERGMRVQLNGEAKGEDFVSLSVDRVEPVEQMGIAE